MFSERWWRDYERRADDPASGIRKPALPFPEWRGEDMAGRRLLVWPEQGLGDKIMFSRWLPQLAGVNVTVLCEPALVRLFRENFRVEVIQASGKTEFPDPDAWTMYGSLPRYLGPAIPPAPYLRADGARKGSARIGICAKGSPAHPNDANRSLPDDLAERLLALPGAMSLHVEDSGAADFLETAQIVSGLDLVITVDTAVAHLAGALGTPVWILLPSVGLDWRWGASGGTTPWYASARLFRQRPGEAWGAVLDRVVALATVSAG